MGIALATLIVDVVSCALIAASVMLMHHPRLAVCHSHTNSGDNHPYASSCYRNGVVPTYISPCAEPRTLFWRMSSVRRSSSVVKHVDQITLPHIDGRVKHTKSVLIYSRFFSHYFLINVGIIQKQCYDVVFLGCCQCYAYHRKHV